MLVANGPSPTAFIMFCATFPLLLTSLVFPSVALAAADTVSVKEWMCEKKRACVCLSMHPLYVDVFTRTNAQRLLGCCLDFGLVMEIETLFLFIPPPAVTVVSGAVRWTQGYGTLGKLSNPLTLPTMQNVTAQNTPWIPHMEKTKAERDIQAMHNLYLALLPLYFAYSEIRSAINVINDIFFIFREHGTWRGTLDIVRATKNILPIVPLPVNK